MTQTRAQSTKANGSASSSLKSRKRETGNGHHVELNSERDHDEHAHSYSHSFFGHSHSHGEEGLVKDGDKILAALKGSGDRGSYITLVGLFSNIVLTGAKGFAGWYMHSASLLADAGHSLSDLLGDFVTLFCWRLSRRPPSERHPYGFAKFETLGTTTISILLIGGALGIGFHSYHLLMAALSDTAASLPPGQIHDILQNITSNAPIPHIGHGHAHSVDPNAAWFAALSVVAKEWLYRITKTVADEENSPVLLANAIHHRSDAYSSLVALIAILGSWLFPAFPFDPIGGLIVSMVILRQGFDLLKGAWGDLTDAGVSLRTKQSLKEILSPLIEAPRSEQNGAGIAYPALLGIRQLRARHAGSLIFVDLIAEVSGTVTITQASTLEEKIARTLKEARKEIKEVTVTFQPRGSEKS